MREFAGGRRGRGGRGDQGGRHGGGATVTKSLCMRGPYGSAAGRRPQLPRRIRGRRDDAERPSHAGRARRRRPAGGARRRRPSARRSPGQVPARLRGREDRRPPVARAPARRAVQPRDARRVPGARGQAPQLPDRRQEPHAGPRDRAEGRRRRALYVRDRAGRRSNAVRPMRIAAPTGRARAQADDRHRARRRRPAPRSTATACGSGTCRASSGGDPQAIVAAGHGARRHDRVRQERRRRRPRGRSSRRSSSPR